MQGLILIAMLFVILIVYILILSFAKGFVKKIVFSLLFTFIWAGDQIVAGVAMHYYCNKYSHVKVYEKPKDVKGFSSDYGITEGQFKESNYTWMEGPVMNNGLVTERFIKKADGQILKETNVKSISRYQIKYQEEKISFLIVSINKRHWWLVDKYTSKKLAEYCAFSPVNYFLTYVPIVYTMMTGGKPCYAIARQEFIDKSMLYKYFF